MARLGIAAAGFLATAVAYGPARMGYGLFLPRFREDFGMSASAAGAVASAAFAAFLLALPVAGFLAARAGPRPPVLAGAAAACLGMGTVAVTDAFSVFVAGVILAAASAGLAWAPFNEAVERRVPEPGRPTALSIISTGTTVGVAAAGLLAGAVALTGLGWRTAWGVFAAAAAVMGAANLLALRDLPGPGGVRPISGRPPALDLGAFGRPEARRPFLAALSFGATSAVYISLAGDRVAQAGGLSAVPASLSGAMLFTAYGAGGLLGLAAGWMEARLGLAALLRAVFAGSAASLALIALAPTSAAAIVASAAMQGASVMVIAAVLAFWSLRVFPDLPAPGFTAVVMALAAGSVGGPWAAGLAIDALGPPRRLPGRGRRVARHRAAVRAAPVRSPPRRRRSADRVVIVSSTLPRSVT